MKAELPLQSFCFCSRAVISPFFGNLGVIFVTGCPTAVWFCESRLRGPVGAGPWLSPGGCARVIDTICCMRLTAVQAENWAGFYLTIQQLCEIPCCKETKSVNRRWTVLYPKPGESCKGFSLTPVFAWHVWLRALTVVCILENQWEGRSNIFFSSAFSSC